MRIRLLIPVLGVVVACGGSGHPQPPQNKGGGTSPPELFAPLFEQGKDWKFALEKTKSGDAGHEVTHGAMSCRVASASHPTATMWVATIACDGDDDGVYALSRPSGVYAATAAGLWRFPDDTVPAEPLDANTMLMAAHPSPQLHEDMVPGQESRSSTAIVEHAKGWCAAQSTNAGDDSGSMLCLRGDVGLLGGSAYFSGGSELKVSWGDDPKP